MSTTVVNIHEAKSRLSELIRAAEQGEEVILARNGVTVAKLITWPPASPKRVPGAWKGKVKVSYGEDLVGSDPDVNALFDASSDSA
jgi:prevent-host-death family protein